MILAIRQVYRRKLVLELRQLLGWSCAPRSRADLGWLPLGEGVWLELRSSTARRTSNFSSFDSVFILYPGVKVFDKAGVWNWDRRTH